MAGLMVSNLAFLSRFKMGFLGWASNGAVNSLIDIRSRNPSTIITDC